MELSTVIFNGFQRWVNAPRWMLRSTFVLLVISLLFHFPNINDVMGLIKGTLVEPNWVNLEQQRDALLTYHEHDPGSHLAKTTFRLTVPAIAKVIHLGPWGIYALQFALGVVMIFLMLRSSYRISEDKVMALLFTTSIVFTFAGSAAFFDSWGHRDPFAFFFLVLALSTRRWYVILPSLLLAAFTDERALVASSFVLIFHLFQSTSTNQQISARGHYRTFTVLAGVLGAWASYALLRMILMFQFGFKVNTGRIGPSVVVDQIEYAPWGLWSGLEGNWLIIIACIWILWRARDHRQFLLFCGALLMVMAVTVMVRDTTRSMAYGFIALFPALMFLKGRSQAIELRIILLFAAIVSILHPMFYSFGDGKISAVEPLLVKALRLLLG